MTQPAAPDSVDWQRRWTIRAGLVTLQPVTRGIAQAVLSGGPLTRGFEDGALHDRIPQALGFAVRDIGSGAAAVLPTAWFIRRADGPIVTAVTGAQHTPSRRLPERQGSQFTGSLPAGEVRSHSALANRLPAWPPQP